MAAPGVRARKVDAVDLLLVQDDAGFAEMLAQDLRDFGHGVTLAGDGRAALHAIDDHAFDAILLDWMLPKVDGLAVLRQMREQGMTVPILMLSARGRTVDKVEALKAGADDYVVKPVATEELDARIGAIVRGRRWTGDGDTIRAGDIVVSPGKVRAWRDGVVLDLGATEFNLLCELARNAGMVVTRAVLVERVWGLDIVPATNIVDTYVCRLRARLALPDKPDPIVTKRGIGYYLRA